MQVHGKLSQLDGKLRMQASLSQMLRSHDLKVVRALANDVVVMRGGQVVEQGAAEDIFERPQTDYTKALLAAALDHAIAPEGVVSQ